MESKAGTIVVGVDGSTSSENALLWAVDQARIEQRTLTLVHAIHAISPRSMDWAVFYPEDSQEAMRAEGHEVLGRARSLVERRAPEVEVHEVFRFDDPRAVLLMLSATAAMVVVGSRGRGTLSSMLLGSVSVALSAHAYCPVVVHRPGGRGDVRNGVLVGADGSEDSRIVLEFAFREAALRGLPLTVLHCYWDTQVGPSAYYSLEPVTDLASEQLLLSESMVGIAEKFPAVVAHTELAADMPQRALVHLGERMDLVVVGVHRGGALSKLLFGSVSRSVIEHANCPVATVPVAAR